MSTSMALTVGQLDTDRGLSGLVVGRGELQQGRYSSPYRSIHAVIDGQAGYEGEARANSAPTLELEHHPGCIGSGGEVSGDATISYRAVTLRSVMGEQKEFSSDEADMAQLLEVAKLSLVVDLRVLVASSRNRHC